MMHVIDGVLYFNAHDGDKGMELWKHDPSTETTSRIYDINAGSTGSSTGKYLSIVVGDVLYFSANDGSTGSEVWANNTSNTVIRGVSWTSTAVTREASPGST